MRWFEAPPCRAAPEAYLHLLHSSAHQQNPIYIGFSLLRTQRTILVYVWLAPLEPVAWILLTLPGFTARRSRHYASVEEIFADIAGLAGVTPRCRDPFRQLAVGFGLD